ncbi:hypothetical protein Lal_00014940 [Lupinus albus]|nr:hypothetical protein Lal_00014940 [Lupinus albus]
MTQVVTLHPPATPASLPKDATWPLADVLALFELPLPELMFRASQAHRANFPDGDVELATLLSIKTGGCEEDCGYCPQAARYDTGVEAKKILDLDTVLDAAREAKAKGATRFCMGAAWRSPKERDMEKVEAMVRGVKALGMETCATLGMLEEGQAEQLKQAGLDYYNHNIDTSPDFYGDVISTRDYRDRLDTLGRVRTAGLKICCGGIVGMGETRAQRAGGRHAAARPAAAGPDRIRAHDRRRPHHDAEGTRAPVGRPARAGRSGAGDVLHGRRELNLLRRQAAHDGQSGSGRRPQAAGKAGPENPLGDARVGAEGKLRLLSAVTSPPRRRGPNVEQSRRMQTWVPAKADRQSGNDGDVRPRARFYRT